MFCVFCKETAVDSSEIIFGRISQLSSSLLVCWQDVFSVACFILFFQYKRVYLYFSFPNPSVHGFGSVYIVP